MIVSWLPANVGEKEFSLWIMLGKKIFFWVNVGAIAKEEKARRSSAENQSLIFDELERFCLFSFLSSILHDLLFFNLGSLILNIFFEDVFVLSLISILVSAFWMTFSSDFAYSGFLTVSSSNWSSNYFLSAFFLISSILFSNPRTPNHLKRGFFSDFIFSTKPRDLKTLTIS